MADGTQSLRKSLDLPRDYVRVKPTTPQAGPRHAPPFRHAKCLALLPLQRWSVARLPTGEILEARFVPYRMRGRARQTAGSAGQLAMLRVDAYPPTPTPADLLPAAAPTARLRLQHVH